MFADRLPGVVTIEATRDPSIEASWQILADGLQGQRLLLHLDEFTRCLEADGILPLVTPDVRPTDIVGALPPMEPDEAAGSLIVDAGLDVIVSLAHRFDPGTGQGRLVRSVAGLADEWCDAGREPVLHRALVEVTAAAAWWTAFFTVIRHRGVHHSTLRPVSTEVSAETLESAARTAATGAALRLVGEAARGDGRDGTRLAYCRLTTAMIAEEASVGGLLEILAELRLVDLVGLLVPWRGRFTKYRSGTGAGQAE
ncbi:hypothetical protein GCM10009557_17890 [Virgisporangium ochraceum]|uniref:Uncharacterized protein n=1 Tax=Virgisporangium ochraceum TaxID=65505 RepID=A0A8J4EFG2_9ACTN|nr:hypothetical protein [Virgisporangium ochraceum]GIJ72686.1 hypothetical protein Voc01_076030 [Virgisporangium ochraceum]